jgi:hypothetical protein
MSKEDFPFTHPMFKALGIEPPKPLDIPVMPDSVRADRIKWEKQFANSFNERLKEDEARQPAPKPRFDFIKIAALAGKHGITYPTNARMEEFLSEVFETPVSGQAAINKIIDEDPANNWWLEEDAFEGWK